MHTYMSLQGVCVSSRGFLFGGLSGFFCLEGFVRGGFCSSPLLSEYIHYNRKLNITFNFRFHMHEICFKTVTSHALGPPPPVTNCHIFLDPLPLERDVLYGRPPRCDIDIDVFIIKLPHLANSVHSTSASTSAVLTIWTIGHRNNRLNVQSVKLYQQPMQYCSSV